MPNIALLGGSFDPPHLAHREVVEYLLNAGKYAEVWVVPAKQNPLKETQTPYAHRLAMCRLAFSELGDRVQVLDDDEKLSGYTVDLLRHLKKLHPEAQFTFIGGADLQLELQWWKEPEILKSLTAFEFLPRPPDPKSPFSEISSTELRWRLKTGDDVSNWVATPVRAYIRNHHLYI